MDVSDSNDELIICNFHLMTTIINQKHKLNERGQKRKIWERDWSTKRRKHGAYHGLVCEMRDVTQPLIKISCEWTTSPSKRCCSMSYGQC